MKIFLSHHRHHRGFTLLQAAITLAVVGLALTAIWGAASRAWSYTRYYQAEKQLVQLVSDVRTALLTQQTVQGTYTDVAATSLIQKLATLDVFPGDMKSSFGTTLLNSPWASAGSTTTLATSPVGLSASDGTTIGATGRYFVVRYQGVTKAGCIQFSTRFNSVVDDVKMTRILINSVAAVPPLSVSLATTRCNGASDSNILEFEFALRS